MGEAARVRDLILARLAALKAGSARVTGDHVWHPDNEFLKSENPIRPAAVLMPIVERHDGLTVLFTRRSDHLKAHAGQISFPGGRVEAGDLDPIATALRETDEEIGIKQPFIDVAGTMTDYVTGTGFQITPVIGFVKPGFTLQPDPFEVAEVFEVPFDFLMDPKNHKRERIHWRGAMREYYAMPYHDHYIWGATAGMLRLFYELMTEEGPR